MSKSWLNLVAVAAVFLSVQACGGEETSPSSLAPLKEFIPPSSISTLSNNDSDEATDEWLRISATFVEPFTKAPFKANNRLYAIAVLSDLEPSASSGSPSNAALMSWENSSWVPVQQFALMCLGIPSCEITIFGENFLASPIVVSSWCCPAGDAAIELPETSLLHVVNGQLVDYIDPSASPSNFSLHYVSFESDAQFTIVDCLERSSYEIPGIGLNGICNHSVETTYRFDSEGRPQVEINETFMKTPIGECLQESFDGECFVFLEATPGDGCPNSTRNNDQFPLRPCDYGIWHYYFETALAEGGYEVVADGYYNSTEVDIVKGFQRTFGLTNDGLVGPQTWGAAIPSSVCSTGLVIREDNYACYEDQNGDGVYGPGDIIPH
jgi:hypothetical protein